MDFALETIHLWFSKFVNLLKYEKLYGTEVTNLLFEVLKVETFKL